MHKAGAIGYDENLRQPVALRVSHSELNPLFCKGYLVD